MFLLGGSDETRNKEVARIPESVVSIGLLYMENIGCTWPYT